MRVPGGPVKADVIYEAARRVVARIKRELTEGRAVDTEGSVAINKAMATARRLAGFGSEQKREIDERGKREDPVHTLDVDIDVVRLRTVLEGSADTGPARLCTK